MTRAFAFLRDDRSGSTAAEFAMVLPVLLMFLIGIIDVGRLLWTWNMAEKATQMGARFAVTTDMVPNTLATTTFVSSTVLQGDTVPTSAFASTSCDSSQCTPATWGYDNAVFGRIVARMAFFYPEVRQANVTVEYSNVGLGFAGDPNGSDVAPLVTVKLRNLTFTPLLFRLFRASISLPDFRTSLTLEDGSGTVSN
jgi:Flp pilus assembly protein TadG